MGQYPGDGALLVTVPSINMTEGERATANDTDPDFCCHDGLPWVCVTGEGDAWISCETHEDCRLGETCQERPPTGLNTVWYKFEAPRAPFGEDSTSVSLSTCFTSGSSTDSLLQAFAASDPTSEETACSSLSPIGCSDDVPGCANGGKNGEMCLTNLTPGDTYYVMVAAKTWEAQTTVYTLSVNSPCIAGQDQKPGDHDFDGDADLFDFAAFQACFTGPGPAVVPACCGLFDLDSRDADVDLHDFAHFNGSLNGP